VCNRTISADSGTDSNAIWTTVTITSAARSGSCGLRSRSSDVWVGAARAAGFHTHKPNEVIDDLGLVAVDPAGEGGEEELEWEEFGHCTRIIR